MMNRSRSLLVVAFAAVAVVNGCNCDPDTISVPGHIDGRVCHPDTGAPLDGAIVSIARSIDGGAARDPVPANSDGRFTFERLQPAEYIITAEREDVGARSFPPVKVRGSGERESFDDTACRDDPLPPNSGNLQGQICNRHTGELITGGDVIVSLSTTGETLTATTDDTGSFFIEAIPEGTHIVNITGEGFQRAFLVTILDGQTVELDLADDCEEVQLGQGGIVGSFCDPAVGVDSNLVGAIVTAVNEDTGEGGEDTTDLLGQFEINGLDPGVYTVDVTHPAYTYRETGVPVIAGEFTTVLDLTQCPEPVVGRVEGEICDQGAGGVFVGTAELIQDLAVVASTQSDANGRFSFEEVVPGTYTVHAFNDSGFDLTFPGIVVRPFQTAFIQQSNCPGPNDVCTPFQNDPVETSDGRILLIVDKSGSMGETFSDGVNEKWDATRNALISATANLSSTVEFGLMLFPERGGGTCEEGTQILPVAPNNAGNVEQQLNLTNPNGGTPTAPTLVEARDILAPLVTDGRPIAALLATDGGPNCNTSLNANTCTCTSGAGFCDSQNCLDDANSYAAVTAIKNLGVSTFIVGITGVDSFSFVLDEMAVRGGTALQGPPGTPKYYEADDPATLEQALAAITTRVLACQVRLDAGGLNDATAITVRIGDQVIAQDIGRANGWDVINDNVVELFGSACDLAATATTPVTVEVCSAP